MEVFGEGFLPNNQIRSKGALSLPMATGILGFLGDCQPQGSLDS